MSLLLDTRQRAMLTEMGVRVWQPRQVAVPVPLAVSLPVQPAAPASPSAPLATTPSSSAPPPNEACPPSDAAPDAAETGAAETGAAAIDAPEYSKLIANKPYAAGSNAHNFQTPETAARPAGIEHMDWPALADAVANCRACGLCAGRTQAVFGVGALQADWMVVGEAPGEQEDRRGEPFVGPAGQLLDAMLAALGLNRKADCDDAANANSANPEPGRRNASAVYIANVLKCRPPGNRNPQPDEVAQCEPYLRRQVALVQPRIILAMGRFAVHSLLNTQEPIGRLRGQVHRYQGVPVIVTYHPAYLLRNLPDKAKAWADLVLAQQVLRGGA